MLRTWILLSTVCFSSMPLLAPATAGDATNDAIAVDIIDDRLSVAAVDASLRELLQVIARQYPLELRLYGTLPDSRRDWRLRGKPVVDTLRQLLRDHSVVMFFESGEDDESKLTRVDVYARDAKSFDEPLITGIETSNDRQNQAQADANAINLLIPEPLPDDSYLEVSQLEGLRDELSVEMLGHNLKRSDSERARLRALELLSELDTYSARRHIVTGLGDVSERIQLSTVAIVSRWQDEEALYALAQVLFGDAPTRVRIAALEELARYSDPHRAAALAFLESALGDENQTVAETARKLIAQGQAQ